MSLDIGARDLSGILLDHDGSTSLQHAYLLNEGDQMSVPLPLTEGKTPLPVPQTASVRACIGVEIGFSPTDFTEIVQIRGSSLPKIPRLTDGSYNFWLVTLATIEYRKSPSKPINGLLRVGENRIPLGGEPEFPEDGEEGGALSVDFIRANQPVLDLSAGVVTTHQMPRRTAHRTWTVGFKSPLLASTAFRITFEEGVPGHPYGCIFVSCHEPLGGVVSISRTPSGLLPIGNVTNVGRVPRPADISSSSSGARRLSTAEWLSDWFTLAFSRVQEV